MYPTIAKCKINKVEFNLEAVITFTIPQPRTQSAVPAGPISKAQFIQKAH